MPMDFITPFLMFDNNLGRAWVDIEVGNVVPPQTQKLLGSYPALTASQIESTRATLINCSNKEYLFYLPRYLSWSYNNSDFTIFTHYAIVYSLVLHCNQVTQTTNFVDGTANRFSAEQWCLVAAVIDRLWKSGVCLDEEYKSIISSANQGQASNTVWSHDP